MRIYDSELWPQENSTATLVVSEATRAAAEQLMTALGRASDDIVVKAGAASSWQLIEEVEQHSPSVVLISATLEDGPLAGFGALHKVRRKFSLTRPIMLLDSGDREQVVASFRGGAKGILLRTDPIGSMMNGVRSVHRGQIWASRTELECTLEALTAGAPLSTFDTTKGTSLNKREEQVVNLVAQGNSDFEIAQKLMLSEQAVKDHIVRIFDKLGLSSRIELILYAFEPHQADIPSASSD